VSYRHPRYHSQRTLSLEAAAIILGMFFMAPIMLLLIVTAVNSAPLTKKGSFCPIGYYRASSYCMPLQSTTPPAVPRTTENCPLGTYTQSDYCVTAQ